MVFLSDLDRLNFHPFLLFSSYLAIKNSPDASLRAEHPYWNMLHVTPPVAGKQTWLGALTYNGREEVAPSPRFPFNTRTPTTVT